MRNKFLQQILDETPKETKIFVEKYGDLVVRIHELLKEKSLSQKDFAKKMGQKPSAVSRWLNGSGNLTLRTIAKMEAELGEDLIQIPQTIPAQTETEWVVYKPELNNRLDIENQKLRSQTASISFPLYHQDGQLELFSTDDNSKLEVVA